MLFSLKNTVFTVFSCIIQKVSKSISLVLSFAFFSNVETQVGADTVQTLQLTMMASYNVYIQQFLDKTHIYLSILGSTFQNNSELKLWRSLNQQPIQAPGFFYSILFYNKYTSRRFYILVVRTIQQIMIHPSAVPPLETLASTLPAGAIQSRWDQLLYMSLFCQESVTILKLFLICCSSRVLLIITRRRYEALSSKTSSKFIPSLKSK